MTAPPNDTDLGVNQHYLDQVVATAAVRDVEASEDIVAGNGMKLLAKGSRVDPTVRDRLLNHKLNKPLEQCLVVADAITPESLLPTAEKLLDLHPFLRELCKGERSQSVTDSLAKVRLSPQLQSLFTFYTGQQDERIAHAVAAALLALGLARRVLPGDIEQHRLALLAGLLHDVGELYIDPMLLKKGTKVAPEQWRHIVSHPVVGHRVLRCMPGAGKAVAEAVLQHHERLDGFGYPSGLSAQALPLVGQVVAAAERLAGLMGSGGEPLTHASVAAKFMPGEFHPALSRTLEAASRAAGTGAMPPATASMEDLVPRMLRIALTMERFGQAREWIDECGAAGSPTLSALVTSNVRRMERIQQVFSSTGLAGPNPQAQLAQFEVLDDPLLHAEIASIVREVEWRLRELERDSLLHAGRLCPADDRIMCDVVARLKGQEVAARPAQATG